MTNQQTCPYCGAELGFYYCYVFGEGAEKRLDTSWYACGTPTDCEFRHADCHKRQLAAKDAEIERLRKALSLIYIYAKNDANSEYCSDTAFDALKEVK